MTYGFKKLNFSLPASCSGYKISWQKRACLTRKTVAAKCSLVYADLKKKHKSTPNLSLSEQATTENSVGKLCMLICNIKNLRFWPEVFFLPRNKQKQSNN